MKAARLRPVALLVVALLPAGAHALGSGPELTRADLRPDQSTLQRGARTVRNLCMLCHDLRYVRYRDLREIGFNDAEIDAMRGGHDIQEPMRSAMTPDQAKRLFGPVPPDLSVMAVAREGGPRYIYDLLTAYYTSEKGETKNRVLPGVAMPDVLGVSVAPSPAIVEQVEGRARDAAAFLQWTADPRAYDRHRIGYGVIAYLALLTILLYLVKRRVWSRLDRH